MKIEMLRPSALTAFDANTRTHSDEQITQIVASMQEFGFTNPVLIDGKNGIIAGHGRVIAAERIGMEKVPCIRLCHLSEKQKRAYVIADNKLAMNAGWDEELLKIELAGLRDDDQFDIGLIGFSDAEIKALFAEGTPSCDTGQIRSTFEVIADCENEGQQEMIYNLITRKGIPCRLSTF